MKIRFQPGDEAQEAVSPEQTAMRKGKPRHLPMARGFVVVLLLALSAWAIYMLGRVGKVYTYGMVAGHLDVKQLGMRGEIMQLNKRPGDQVKRGEVLVVVRYPDGAARAAEARNRIETAKTRLEGLEEQNIDLSADPEILRELQRQEEISRSLRNELEALREINRELSRARYEVELAQFEVAKLDNVSERMHQRLETVERLFALDAATREDVRAAGTEAVVARYNLEQAMTDLAAAEQALEAANVQTAGLTDDQETRIKQLEQSIADNQQRSEAIRKALAARQEETIERQRRERETEMRLQRQELASAQEELERVRQYAEPVELRAVFDGVVVELPTHSGAFVQPGETILTVASTDQVWVDAYVPLESAEKVNEGVEVKMYSQLHKTPVIGTLASKGVIARIPTALEPLLPRQNTGVYVRIEPPEEADLQYGELVRVVIQ